jgi:N-acetylmuramoyl-L-alanine amidase
VKTQASTTLTRGNRAFRLGASLLLLLLPLASASARTHHNDAWARQQFAHAERMREALNGRPLAQRTRHEYQRVIDSYRRVYFGSPASSKADPSVVATAELMVEMGRRFDDNKILRGAVEQYRFLRKEYPGSKYRFDALFTVGEIFKDDLNDPEQARATFEDFLHRYPRNRLADDAHAAIKEMSAVAEEKEHAARKASRNRRPSGANSAADGAAAGVSAGAEVVSQPGTAVSASREGLPRVTGVRHWSTPDYTRVAIDVEQEVKFGSQRIAHPDRIFFDLRDTKLASTLVGKTFDVDDGFLKKIRVAEFQPGRTRIVLEVDDLASYDAFLLPDPYRLIIDIHGKGVRGQQRQAKVVAADLSKSDLANSRPALDPPVVASPESDGDSNIAAAGEESSPRNSRAESQNSKVDVWKSGPVETDLPVKAVATNSEPAESARPVTGIGVIKTTVVVKGSSRRIPKTIVEAEDQVPSKVAKFDRKKLRFEKTPEEVTAAAEADEAATPKSSLGNSASANSARRKNSHSSTSDLAGLDATREARPTAIGDRSLIRALGLKIGKIVIDAGHGGHDTGTIGPNGLLEKDVVLDVAKRLGRLLESRLGAEVIYTRRDDTFIPLETRTAIANQERADLFISIHANSSHDSDARGVETYYLNFTSSPEALEVAARENAVSEKSIHELQDLVKKIALKEKIDESREFAGDVQQSLYGGLALNNAGVRNRGIKKAPFIVLIGANMPSILAEISFVSNPTDERKMETAEHRQRIAESLYRGVSKYVSGLSGVKVASRIDKPEGQ